MKKQTAPIWETLKKGFQEYLALGLSRPQDSPKRKLFFLCHHLFFAVFFTVCVGAYIRMGAIVIAYRIDEIPLWELAVDAACVFVMALLEWIPGIRLLHERRERRRREKKWWL